MIRVDITEFDGNVIKIPVSKDTTISDCLDVTYVELRTYYRLPHLGTAHFGY